jgi:hypothetical protein
MAISEQFKSLNLNQKKMRKLCTDEVTGVKMKNNERTYFLYCSFLAAPLALHFKDDL